MGSHSSVLAWRIPGMGEPGGLLSIGSHRVGHERSNSAAADSLFMFKNLSIVSLEKEMATHSSILAWKIPWTEKPGILQSMGLQRVGHD